MTNKQFNISVLALAVILLGLGSWFFSRADHAQPPEKTSIGFAVGDTSVLLLIAEDQGFFAANRLDATLKTYDTAVAASAGMNRGEVDIAETAEFPIVSEAFRKTGLSIIAGIDRFDIINLVGRRGRGIQSISDLKGKKIGVPKGTVAEFYLGRFLELNGIGLKDVNIVNLTFAQAVDALPGGSADAFEIRSKDISTVKERLGSDAVIWPSQSGQMGFEVLSGRNDWVTGHSTTIARVLKALLQAEAYVVNHPAEARAIVQERLKYDDAHMTALASVHRYSLSLDQSLITAMEDEARWMMANNLTTEKTMPNFLEYLYEDGLKAVKPDAVNIIR